MTDGEEFENHLRNAKVFREEETEKCLARIEAFGEDEPYMNAPTQWMWIAWQAAKQSQAAEIKLFSEQVKQLEVWLGDQRSVNFSLIKQLHEERNLTEKLENEIERLFFAFKEGCIPINKKSSWQPIETAPKDQRILVRTENEVYAAHWAQHPVTGDEAWIVAEWGTEGDQALVKPIEWRYINSIEMTEERAREILGGEKRVFENEEGNIYTYFSEDQEYYIDELKAIVFLMESKK